MESAELRHEIRVLLKKVVDIYRREGMGPGSIARELSVGHSPTGMNKLCTYLRVLGERNVQHALFSLAKACRHAERHAAVWRKRR